MGRAAFLFFAAVVVVAVVAPGVATAREPVTNEPFTIPANRCGFPIDVGVVATNEYQDVTTLADGSVVTKITGKLVLSFTNTVSGKTIVRNVSGPSTEIDHPDGSGTFTGQGLTWFAFGPVTQGNTGEPGLVFTNGLVTLDFAGGAGVRFTLAGSQVDGCELLSG